MEMNPEIQTWAERADQEQKEIFQYFVPDGTLRSESDITLSAFAQLAALRLNTTRALISILDSANQYVLVEATRDSRLRRDRPATDERDDLLLGRTTLTRSLGLCGHVLDNVNQHESELAGEKLWRPPYVPFMVGDVAVDEKLRDHPFVTSHPSVRFYAAMPICTESGLRVGTISVMDERPRKELLGVDEIEFLGDIGPAIMAYLETTRISDGHRRGEKMIRGLGVFMEGRTDLRDWWCELGDSRHAAGQQPALRVHEDDGSTMKVEAAPANSEFADGLDVANRLLVTTPSEYTTAQEPLPSLPETTASRQPTPLAIPPKPSAQTGSGPEHGRSRGPEAPGRASLSEGYAQSPPPSRGQSSRTFGPGLMDGPRPISKKLKKMFSRAAHIIQEAIDVDGALFLDASVSTPSERSESVRSTERGGSSRSSTNTSESSPGQAQEHVQAPCRVLSLWTSERSSLHGDGSSRLIPLAESFLLGLLNKYPQGHVFSPGEAPGPGHHKKEKGEAAALETMLPGARSVVVVPLWDANAGRWFAAGCMWTVNPTSRVLTRGGDLNYLAAFGNSIMAEVARLDVVRTDRAKSDFISSISHELRSPLHGILASAELLHDTTVDLFQRGMIDTIERCGRTLLDTIQHVLDFAKINNFTKRGSLSGMSNLSVDVNLSLLTEDVVDSVFAGHEFQSESNDPSSPFATADETGGGFHAESLRDNSAIDDRGRRSSNESNKEPIDVILDITWRPNWFFRTESGALRRVLMNLFGNALKYTDRGWVKVSLQAKDIDATKSTITITVTDSGRGIDPEYLHGALFTPFTQENSLNPGTGLGLSIVLQIVRSLRGRISITSELGVGTQVVVTLVMKQVPPPHERGEPRHFLAKNQEAIRSARGKTEGLRVGLSGFGSPDRRPENADGHAEWNSRTGREPSLPLLRQSIESAATQWFGMKITPPSMWTFSPPDIHIVNERAGIRDAFPGVPVIALCSHEELYRVYSQRAARSARRAARELAHFVSKPCGPHKLAEAFDFCLQNISRSSAAASPSMGAPPGAFGSPQNSLFAQTPSNYTTDHSRAQEDYSSGPTTKAETLTRQATAVGTVEASSSVPRERKPRLLLVDDNKINLNLLSTFIGRCCFDYSTAENGVEAVQAFSAATEHPYDIILMDISMPIMDGTEATRKIRKLEQAHPRKRPAMVIALTGLGSANSRKDAFDSGVNMFLTKPVRLKDLKKILEDWDPDGVA